MKKESRFPFELDLEGARKIINVSCSEWAKRLLKVWHGFLMVDTIPVGEDFYKEMRKACDEKQHKVLDEVFGKDEESVRDELLKIDWACANDGIVDFLLERFNIEFKK